MAKKIAAPKKNQDDLTALAGLGVELAVLMDKVDALASRVGTIEKRLDEMKWLSLHHITTNQKIDALTARVDDVSSAPKKKWIFW